MLSRKKWHIKEIYVVYFSFLWEVFHLTHNPEMPLLFMCSFFPPTVSLVVFKGGEHLVAPVQSLVSALTDVLGTSWAPLCLQWLFLWAYICVCNMGKVLESKGPSGGMRLIQWPLLCESQLWNVLCAPTSGSQDDLPMSAPTRSSWYTASKQFP